MHTPVSRKGVQGQPRLPETLSPKIKELLKIYPVMKPKMPDCTWNHLVVMSFKFESQGLVVQLGGRIHALYAPYPGFCPQYTQK